MWSGQDECLTQHTPRNYMYDNFVFLQTELSEDTCHHLIADMSKWILSEENKGKKLNVFINSPGGDVTIMNQISGLLMLAKVREITIITWVLGYAASSASLIAVQGDQRFMSRNAYHLIHFGSFYDVVTKQTEIEKSYKWNKELHDKICQIYLSNCENLTKEKLNSLMEDEHGTLFGDDCLKYGFCDLIIDDAYEDILNDKLEDEKNIEEFENWKKSSKNMKKLDKNTKKSSKNTKKLDKNTKKTKKVSK